MIKLILNIRCVMQFVTSSIFNVLCVKIVIVCDKSVGLIKHPQKYRKDGKHIHLREFLL